MIHWTLAEQCTDKPIIHMQLSQWHACNYIPHIATATFT